jgi:hypothetical protein
MRTVQSNYLNMINAVRGHFSANTSVWSNNPLIASGVNNLNETGDAITAAATKQKINNPTGHTVAKERARNELEELVYRTSVRLRTYARLTNNDVLAVKLDVSQSALDRMKHNELLTFGRVIVAACEEHLSKLENYQIDSNTVSALSQSINLTASLYTERDTVVDQRGEVTADLDKLFTVARNQLKILDDLVEGYIDNETFVATYFNARRIHDLGGRRTKKDEQTKED